MKGKLIKPSAELENHQNRFVNAIAIFLLLFIVSLYFVVQIKMGFRLDTKLLLLSSLIPFITFILTGSGNFNIAKYWLSYVIPISVILISLIIKKSGDVEHYEYFGTRIMLVASVLIPLLIFSITPLKTLLVALLPSAICLFFFDPIHNIFNVGYTDLFVDNKNGYLITSLLFDSGYLFVVLGLLSLKKSNSILNRKNKILIVDLNNKNNVQENLIAENKEVNSVLLTKQNEILESQNQLERASTIIKEQKEMLEYKNIELTSKVEEKTKDLELVNNDLVIKNNGLAQFSNTISHDLRGPVARLLGLVQLFEMEKETAVKEEMVSHIKSSAMALDAVISDLNKVVDVRNQLHQLNEILDLRSEILRVEQLLKVGLKGIEANFVCKLEVLKIYFIKSYIHSILYNLISNAIKYSKPDKKNIITVLSYTTGNSLFIEVQDEGIGIDLIKFSNDIFKMHKRFHLHLEGKGVGLYLVKQQVEGMKGEISVKSEPGKGASFVMKFPVSTKPEFQEYYNSDYAKIDFCARFKVSILSWYKTPSSVDFKKTMNVNKEIFANYDAANWVIDVRNTNILSEEDRDWFASNILIEVIDRGCKAIVFVKNESDNKDYLYWKNVIAITKSNNVIFKVFFDYQLALEYIEKKELVKQN